MRERLAGGTDSFDFSGRLGGPRLKPGRYSLHATPHRREPRRHNRARVLGIVR